MKIQIFHNILWSKYKAIIFSSLNNEAVHRKINIKFVQIASTSGNRVGLSDVDLSYHQYPFKLLFEGSYDEIPKLLLNRKLFNEVWYTDADLILIPGYHLVEYWSMLLAARLRGKTVGVFCDSTAFDRPSTFLKNLLKRIFFSQCAVIFGYGTRSHDYILSFGVPKDRIIFGCQAAALIHNYNVADVLARRNTTNVCPHRFLYVGRLSPEKNIADLIHAFNKVVSVYADAKLIIIGQGLLEKQLIELSVELRLTDLIEFVGPKDMIYVCNEYLKADCLVLPSSSEPWGLVVNEALSFGCPVIVSNRCGCVPELVIEGVTGYSFECGNIDDMATKMIKASCNFVDKELTAKNCLDLMANFTPEIAANHILSGCINTLNIKNHS